MGLDCSSLSELLLAEKLGVAGDKILFSSNDTPKEEFIKAKELGARINLDDITHLEFLEKTAGLSDFLSFRYNPGSIRKGSQFIGNPEEAKFGLTHEQIFQAFQLAKEKGVKHFGIQTMIVSNMLDETYLMQTADMLFQLVAEISEKVGVDIEFISLGGGFGIPYKMEEKPLDLEKVSIGIQKAYKKFLKTDKKVQICLELGRYIVGPYGYLITTVRHVTHKYRDYVGVDTSVATLLRPAMYGSYHHITVLGKEKNLSDKFYDVTGSMCENNDKLAIQRKLPTIEVGDVLAIHDAGAYGYAMSNQFNGKLRPAELLLGKGGKVSVIRRAETVNDYFATMIFPQKTR